MFLRPGAGCRGADELSPYKAEHETPVAMLNPKEVAPFCREEPRQPLVGFRLLSGTSLDQSSAATSRGRSLPWQRWTGDSYSPLIAEDARCCLDGILRGRENLCYWDGERDFFFGEDSCSSPNPRTGRPRPNPVTLGSFQASFLSSDAKLDCTGLPGCLLHTLKA